MSPTPSRVVTTLVMASLVAGTCLGSACGARPGSTAQASSAPRVAPVRLTDVDFVQFRWEDSTSRAAVRFIDPASRQPVTLSDSVVLDIRGIDSARVWQARGDTAWGVVLLLTPEGAAQFGATTATHVGHRLGIVVDSAITQLPIIQSALGPRVPLVSGVPKSVADSLALRVTHAVEALRPYHRLAFPRDLTRRDIRFP